MKKLTLIIALFSTMVLSAQDVEKEKEAIKKVIQTAYLEGLQNEGDLIKEVVEQYYIKGLQIRNFSLIRTICINEAKLHGAGKISSINITSLDQWSKKFDPNNTPFKTLEYKINKIDYEGTAAQVKILLIINSNTDIYWVDAKVIEDLRLIISNR